MYWTESTPEALQAKLEVNRIVTFALIGVFSRELIVALRHDWAIIRGSRCCDIRGALLYFVCRHTTTAALTVGIITTTRGVAHLSLSFVTKLVDIRQGFILMSDVFAYHLFVIRVVAIWRHPLIGYSLNAAMLTLYCLNIYASTMVGGPYNNRTLTNVIATMMMTVNTALLILCVAGLLRANKRHDFPTASPALGYKGRSTLYVLYKEGVLYFVISWISQIAIMTLDYAALDPQRMLLAVMGVTILVIRVICACRMHQDMIDRSTTSPLSHSLDLFAGLLSVFCRRQKCPKPTPAVCASQLQLYRSPPLSESSGLTTSSWRSPPESEFIELSIIEK